MDYLLDTVTAYPKTSFAVFAYMAIIYSAKCTYKEGAPEIFKIGYKLMSPIFIPLALLTGRAKLERT